MEQLWEAIEVGDADKVRRLIDSGAPLDVTSDEGGLVHAALDLSPPASSAILWMLIDGGAPIDGYGVNGWTPLHEAAVNGHPADLRLLLEHGAQVDAPANLDGGPAALADAAYAGRADSVEILLRAGAKPGRKDEFGNTALQQAREALEGPEAGGVTIPAGLGEPWIYEREDWSSKSGKQREVIKLLEAL